MKYFFAITIVSAALFVSIDTHASYSKENNSPYDNDGEFRKPQPTSVKTFRTQQEYIHYHRSQMLKRKNADKYEKHIREVSGGGFDEPDRSAVQSRANAYYPKEVLISGSAQSNVVPRVARYRNRGRSLNSVEALNSADIDFLNGLADGIQDKVISASLKSLIQKQNTNELWTKSEYDFLSNLASNINNDQAGLRLHRIAEKRRESIYET